jgi:hypothetical protein
MPPDLHARASAAAGPGRLSAWIRAVIEAALAPK